ncbi:hypothetical protein [Bradyrhizobium sp.]|uniref:hypothetical protein n=1 Tax=Bradyrhizobium sp. TaxID=376 RepID=UPI002CF32A40|nr:hypothetical protein [Bradyrhizobium sp.]HMM92481.1 hypothetical protein [Bradyrhizobium sp.]
MQDYRSHLEKLRRDAAECALAGDLDKAKREMFDRLARHLEQPADEVARHEFSKDRLKAAVRVCGQKRYSFCLGPRRWGLII